MPRNYSKGQKRRAGKRMMRSFHAPVGAVLPNTDATLSSPAGKGISGSAVRGSVCCGRASPKEFVPGSFSRSGSEITLSADHDPELVASKTMELLSGYWMAREATATKSFPVTDG
jgi:hypothetical protein